MWLSYPSIDYLLYSTKGILLFLFPKVRTFLLRSAWRLLKNSILKIFWSPKIWWKLWGISSGSLVGLLSNRTLLWGNTFNISQVFLYQWSYIYMLSLTFVLKPFFIWKSWVGGYEKKFKFQTRNPFLFWLLFEYWKGLF